MLDGGQCPPYLNGVEGSAIEILNIDGGGFDSAQPPSQCFYKIIDAQDVFGQVNENVLPSPNSDST
jgi:hypothetical protein